MKLKRLIKKVLNASHTFEEDERLLMYKFQTLMALIILSSSVVFVMMFIRYMHGNYKQAIADLIFISVTLFGAAMLQHSKKFYYMIARVVLFSGLAVATWLIHAVPDSQSRVIWFSMIIAIMFFMLNKKEGLYWLGTLIAVLSVLFIQGDFLHLQLLDFGIFISNLIMLAIVLLWYESIKKDNETYMHNNAAMLEMKITERTKELEIALHEAQSAQKAKDSFFANMSHELRTPLNAIIGFSQILSKQPEIPQNIQPFIEKINIAGKNLLQLINTVLNFSKIESENMQLNKEEIHLQSFFKELTVLIEPQAQAKNIHFKLDIEGDSILADVQLLHQAILNILANAVKFTHEYGEISLSSRVKNGQLTLKICDTGVGIDSNDLEKLFKPFSQLDNEYQAKVNGTGLGLYLSSKIVNLHDGSITIDSEPGKGTCFTIVI